MNLASATLEPVLEPTLEPEVPSYRTTRLSHLQFLRSVPRLLTDRADAILDLVLEHGDVVEVPIPGKRVHIVTHPDLLRHILVTNSKNYTTGIPGFHAIVSTFLGDGIIATRDKPSQAARRAAMPGFRQKYVEAMSDAVIREVDRFDASQLGNRQVTLPTHETMSRLSLRMFASTVLSVDVRPDQEKILNAMHIAVRHLDTRLAAIVDCGKVLPTPANKRFAAAIAEVNAVFHRWVEDRVHAPDQKDDLMGMFLCASESMDAETRSSWLRHQIVTLLAAGHETVAAALGWGLLLLARNPEVQDKMRDEMRVYGVDGKLTAAVLPKLTYTSAVVDEVLRLYPSVWSYGRQAIHKDRIENVTIPAGATVMLCPYALHRRPDLWGEEVGAFQPERFLGKEPTPFGYMPFSVGPSRCLGENLSRLELKVTLASLINRYVVDRPNDTPVGKEALISLRPEPDFELRFTPRKGQASA